MSVDPSIPSKSLKLKHTIRLIRKLDNEMAYAGMSPSIYPSRQLTNCYSHMEKLGSRYLLYALFNVAKYVCIWDPTFSPILPINV